MGFASAEKEQIKSKGKSRYKIFVTFWGESFAKQE